MNLRNLIAQILDISVDSITEATSPQNAPNWDSFSGLLLAAELEKSAKVKFTIQEVISVKSVGDIKKILDKYNVKYDF